MKVNLKPYNKKLKDDPIYDDRIKAMKVSYNMQNSGFYVDFQSLINFVCLNFLNQCEFTGTEYEEEYGALTESGSCVKALKMACFITDRNDLYHSLLETNFNDYANNAKHNRVGCDFKIREAYQMVLLYNELIRALALPGSVVTLDLLVTGKKQARPVSVTMPSDAAVHENPEAPLKDDEKREIEEGIWNYYGYRILSLLGDPFEVMDNEELEAGVVDRKLVTDGFNLIKVSITDNPMSGEIKTGLFGRRCFRFMLAASYLQITKSDMSGAFMKANRLKLCYLNKDNLEKELKISYPDYHMPFEIPADEVNSSTLHFKAYLIYRGKLREKSTVTEFDLKIV